jgi:addiction module HigA family antidote
MGNKNQIEIEHPGIILKEEFMEPYKISAYRLSKETGIDKMTLSGVLRGLRNITPQTALKLSKFFGLSEKFWINLQIDYDLRITKHELHKDLDKIHTLQEIIRIANKIT